MKKLPLWEYSLISGFLFWVLFIGIAVFISNTFPLHTSFWVPDFSPIFQAISLAIAGTVGFILYTAENRKIYAFLATITAIILIFISLIVLLYSKNRFQ